MKSSIKNKNLKSIDRKRVTFNEIIIIYSFVDSDNRKSYWIENRCHFQRHCHNIQNIISFVFEDSHRRKIQNLIESLINLESK